MQKLEVFVIDKARCRLTGSIPYTSLLWARRYYECGYFMMTIPADIYTEEWAYICTADRPETGRIQKVEYQDTDTTGVGKDTIILWGYFLESYMYDHTFLVEEIRFIEQLVQPNKPTNPMESIIAENKSKTLYKTDDGEYICTDAHGNLIGDNGEVEQDFIINAEEVFYINPVNSYFYNDENDNLHWVDGAGVENTVGDIIASDGVTSYFMTENGSICKAIGITTKSEMDSYESSLWYYKEKITVQVPVKGYWASLDVDQIESINTPKDPIQRLTDWVHMFYQNGLLIIEPTITAVEKIIDPSLKNLGELLYEELKLLQASFRIIYNFETDKMMFEIWQGEDKTQSQTKNPWSVFSDEWGTLYNFEASVDTSSYKNTCYVLYEFDENNKGVERVTVGEPDETERAIYLDLRGEQPEEDETFERFLEGVKNRGIETLKNEHSIVENLDTGTLNLDRYLKEFDLGDKVDMTIAQIGIKKECRIIGVDETYEADEAAKPPSISVIMGDEKITNARKAWLV